MAEGSAAAAAGVAASDVITHVAGQQVGSLAGFKSVMVNAMLEGGAVNQGSLEMRMTP